MLKKLVVWRLIVGLAVIPLVLSACGKSALEPDKNSSGSTPYRTIHVSPLLELRIDNSIADSISFSESVEDTASVTRQPMPAPQQALATWVDGTRTGYGWDADRDFYINFRTPRSCCYRVSYTYALYYALKASGKPLIVYATGTNADGSINWHIIIGGSVLRYISPVADWFLFWQAKMQYYG